MAWLRQNGWLGALVFVLALALFAWAIVTMTRAGSNVPTNRPTTTIVENGPYRFTRNPMYLGMAGILLGVAIYAGSLTPFIVIPAFMGLIAERFIAPEEEMLEKAFGQAYAGYKARVRRWL